MGEVDFVVAAMGIGLADVEQEGLVAWGGDEVPGLFDGGDGVASFGSELEVVLEDVGGGDVVFADEGGAITGAFDDLGEGETDGVGITGEMAGVVGVAVVAVGVIVQSGHDDGAAGAAAGGGGVGVGKHGAIRSECVDVGCFDDVVAITAQGRAKVVRDVKHDVFLGSVKRDDDVDEADEWEQEESKHGGDGTKSMRLILLKCDGEGGRLIRLLMKILWLGLMMLSASVLMGAERPNVVFLLVDDWRWNAVGCMGDPIVKTPHIDALAKEGVVFENMFVTTSICSVSRASIFTGQWSRRHGIVDFATGLSDEQWSETYPALMRKAGYQLGLVGKLGVGNEQAMKAREKDFDFWRGVSGQGGKFFIEPDDPQRKHLTAKFGDAALEFLKGMEKGRPFCLSVSFSAVHARDKQPREFQPDVRDEGLYEDVEIPMPALATEEAFAKLPEFVKTSEGRKRWGWRFDEVGKAQGILKDYYRLVTGVDREVGRIREVLQSRGLAENTVIVVTGDNGFALGDRGLADKWFMWDEDLRVPLVLYDPRLAVEQRGRRIAAMALNVDHAPTLLELAGIKIPTRMQGRSLVPLMKGDRPEDWRTEYFYEHLVFPKIIPPVEGVRTERWKYIRWVNSEPLVEELYDLESDPLEQSNLVGENAHLAKLEELRAKWQGYGESLK